MANEGKVRITQTSSPPTYCRRYNGAGYDDYDAELDDLSGAGTDLWGAANHILYWGYSAKQYSLGARILTAPVTGALTWEYSTGAAAWTAFTPFYDGTNSLTDTGFMAWSNPPAATAWASHTHTGALPDAYWIRASIASHTTTGVFLNFLRTINVLNEPLTLKPTFPPLNVTDINQALQSRDLVYAGPNALTLRCVYKAVRDANGNGMPMLNLLHYWHANRSTLYIEDLAQNSTTNLVSEGLYKNYTGRLDAIEGDVHSPHKMHTSGFTLRFVLSASTAVME
ncbi:MAG TPA: hypothetical protein VLH56_19245 [Dissulfurispiraceae bacterium]|nr:hypothetical protein [Dissulfurispiraceae bacterium]